MKKKKNNDPPSDPDDISSPSRMCGGWNHHYPPPPQPETIIQPVTYKPFADDHNNKFSLGDFDSPYLVRLNDYTNFVASNSSILLNNVSHEVTKTDYQGSTYLGIAGFSFSDYANFLSTNAILTIQVNLVASDGSVITNKTIAGGLMVTKATNLYTWQDLQGMQHNLAGGYQLMNDITFPDKDSEGLPPEGFDPVGDNGARFTGSFAGNNHRIVNLSIERSINFVGIWGYVNNANSVIKDFVVNHAGIRGNSSVGGVVGLLNSGMVSNVGVVSSLNSNISGIGNVGGLVGDNRGTVTGYATGTVSGTGSNIGGLVGTNNETVVGYATGEVSGTTDTGGLVGDNNGAATGYATGSVSGTENVGGLVGNNIARVNGYATGAVSGTENVGGLLGNNSGGTSTVNGYATGAVSGTGSNIGGLLGRYGAGTLSGYWDIESSMRNISAGGVGISSITNVVYASTAGTYTDNKATAGAMDDVVVFDNAAFLMHFTLPGASETWPTLKAETSFPQP